MSQEPESSSDKEKSRTPEEALLAHAKRQKKKPSHIYTLFEAPLVGNGGAKQTGLVFKCKMCGTLRL